MRTGVGTLCLVTTGALFGLYLCNVLLGKAALMFEFKPILVLGDVGEFLVLLAAVVCLIFEAVRRESHQNQIKTKSAYAAEEEIE